MPCACVPQSLSRRLPCMREASGGVREALLEISMNLLVEKFNGSYERVTESGCWIWIADCSDSTLQRHAYGRLACKSRRIYAHRFSYELYRGKIPDGLHVLHQCDVSLCVNPAHLELGTHQRNMREAAERGRMARGSRQRCARLTDDSVKEIKTAFLSWYPGIVRDQARKYGVHIQTLWNIKYGRTWAHVQPSFP